jgi:predicted nucleotidyltransferase
MMAPVISTNTIFRTLQDSLNEVRIRYHVDKLALFGSRAQGDARENSNIDILVDFSPGADLLDLSGLKLYFEVYFAGLLMPSKTGDSRGAQGSNPC